jgi:hypothetical protein
MEFRLLTNDVAETQDVDDSKYGCLTRGIGIVRSAYGDERKLGVLYLDTSVKGDNFNRDHLQRVCNAIIWNNVSRHRERAPTLNGSRVKTAGSWRM